MNAPDDHDYDDDYEIIGVRHITPNTSIYRCHTSLTVKDAIDLIELEEAAENIISVDHILHLLVTLTLTLTARLSTSNITIVLSKTFRIILALLALCDNEIDVLTQVEVNIRVLRPEDHPPLLHSTKKNRLINSLQPDFAYRITRFTKEQLRKLLINLCIPYTIILPRRRYRFTGNNTYVCFK